MLIDFGWQVGKLGIAKITDLMTTPGGDPLLANMAAKLVESGQQPDLIKAMDEAARMKAEQDRKIREAAERNRADRERARADRERLRINVRARESGITFTQFNPVGCSTAEVLGVRVQESWAGTHILATDKQVETLMRFKVPEAEARAMSRRTASEHLDVLISRARNGLATLGQVKCLMKNRVPREEAWGYTFEDASRFIDNLSRRRA